MQSDFDGSHFEPQQTSNFLQLQILKIVEHHDAAGLCRKYGQGIQYNLPPLLILQGQVGIIVAFGRAFQVLDSIMVRHSKICADGFAPPGLIDAQIMTHPQQPGFGLIVAQGLFIAPQAQKGLLGNIGGVLRVAQAVQRQTVYAVPILL